MFFENSAFPLHLTAICSCNGKFFKELEMYPCLKYVCYRVILKISERCSFSCVRNKKMCLLAANPILYVHDVLCE